MEEEEEEEEEAEDEERTPSRAISPASKPQLIDYEPANKTALGSVAIRTRRVRIKHASFLTTQLSRLYKRKGPSKLFCSHLDQP